MRNNGYFIDLFSTQACKQVLFNMLLLGAYFRPKLSSLPELLHCEYLWTRWGTGLKFYKNVNLFYFQWHYRLHVIRGYKEAYSFNVIWTQNIYFFWDLLERSFCLLWLTWSFDWKFLLIYSKLVSSFLILTLFGLIIFEKKNSSVICFKTGILAW